MVKEALVPTLLFPFAAPRVTGSLAETVAGSVAISPPPSDSGSGDTAQEGTDD